MDFNLDEMSLDELNQLLQAIQIKLDAMASEGEGAGDGEAREGEDGEGADGAEGAEGGEGGEGGEPAADIPAEIAEIVEGLTDDLEELETLIDQVEGRKATITANAERRKKLIARVKRGDTGKVIRTFQSNEEVKENMFGIESKEYRNAFLKNLQGKPVSAEERTALANGSYVIPQETLNKIYGKMELYPLINAVEVMHIPGTVIVPVEGTVNAAAVVAMGTAATDSADSMAQVSLGVYKLIKTIEITADVEAMAIDAFETWLVERLANKLYRLVTKMIAAGTGSSEPTGLCAASGGVDATGCTYTKAAITFTDILAIIAALPTEYTPGATFVMSRTTFWQNVLAVKDSDNRPIVVADAQSPAKFNVMGFPVILEDEVGTDIIFGDLKEGYVWNFGKDIDVARDESVGFRTGSTVFRGMCLGDGKPTGVGLVRYTKAS